MTRTIEDVIADLRAHAEAANIALAEQQECEAQITGLRLKGQRLTEALYAIGNRRSVLLREMCLLIGYKDLSA